jgi:uncharacterized membrane protein YfcA
LSTTPQRIEIRPIVRWAAGTIRRLTWGHAVIILLAGAGAGTINAVAGSGSLITFSTLIALGYPPVLANVSNNIGLVPGAVSGAYGYRRELRGQRRRLTRLLPASTLGGLVGAVLLLVLPSSYFKNIVIVLIIIALVLVMLQPKLSAFVQGRALASTTEVRPVLLILVAATGVYGGYFGAAQGIILIAILGVMIKDDLQRLNGAKNVLTGAVNLVASVVFVFAAHVDWRIAGLIAVGSVIGAQLGATYGRRLDARALRAVIVVVGLVALERLLF